MMHIFLSILIICAANLTQCATQEKPQLEGLITEPLPFASNGLLIYLDTANEIGDRIGVVSHDLLVALDQKPCAILASRLLIRDIVKQPTPREFVNKLKARNDRDAQSYENLVKGREKIKDYLATAPANPTYPEDENIIAAINEMVPTEFKYKTKRIDSDFYSALDKEIYTFNPSEWVIKQVGDQLLLLIPKEYINKLNAQKFAQHYNQGTYSTTELNLGLKIDHLQDISSLDAYVNEYRASNDTTSGKFVLSALPSLFITRAEYKQVSKQKASSATMPQWSICLMGHGSTTQFAEGSKVADMVIDDFKQLLDFFDTKITTKLVIYQSCYAAGENTQKIYGDLKSSWLKTNPYTVVTNALTDAPVTKEKRYTVTRFSTNSVDFANHKLKPGDLMDYKKFFDVLAKENVVNFTEVLANLFPPSGDPRNIFGTPQIKLPGVAWFNIIDVDKNIVSIGQILATSRSANQPLDVMTFFKRNWPPVAILLYANIIPFELKIPVTQMPVLVSMIPGDSLHEIAKISVNTTLKDFIDALKPLEEIRYRKLFVINKLKVTGVSQDGQGDTEFEDVHIRISRGLPIRIYVTNKDKTYFQWNTDTNMLDEMFAEYADLYLMELGEKEKEQLEKAREKMQQSEQIRKAQEKKIKEIQEKQKQTKAN